MYVKVLVTQSCLTLFDRIDPSLLGSFVHAIPRARILERVASPFSRGSSIMLQFLKKKSGEI